MTELLAYSGVDSEFPAKVFFSPYARLGVPMVEHHCRHCDAPIYSRRQRSCGRCAKPLPDSSLFTAEQRATVCSVLAEERQQHRQWLRRH